jgi:uncharacterized protein (TIGR00369 family)
MLKVCNQKQMEEVIRQAMEMSCRDTGSFNALITPRFVECDFDGMTMILEYPVQKWELNPAGVLHGGIIAAIFDVSMAALILPYAGGFAPTINLDIKYIKPVKEGDTLMIKAAIVSLGKNMVHTEAKAYSKTSNALSSAGTGSYSLKLWDSNLINGEQHG